MLVNIETGRPRNGLRRRAITIDELAYLAKALNVSENRLLHEQTCAACGGSPPKGFTCNACGFSQPDEEGAR
ncbi:hypothetical protein BJF79_13595 [Actinomadura sp. CNU-125]|nr:hypothetical protein BJF79_13595 [Actinomadura sp. CNU-125]